MTTAQHVFIGSLLAFLIWSPLTKAQNPPQKPPSMPSWSSAPQPSQADLQNFPPLLLQQLSAIKAAALNDDYAYREVTHLTENIVPQPRIRPRHVLEANRWGEVLCSR